MPPHKIPADFLMDLVSKIAVETGQPVQLHVKDTDFGWSVESHVDEDGHFNVIISNSVSDDITEVDVDGDNKGWVRYRFTTKAIEKDYLEEVE